MNIPIVRLVVPLLCGLLCLTVASSNAKEPEKAKPSPAPKSSERATTVKSSKSNSSDRAASINGTKSNTFRGTVTQVDQKAMTFSLKADGKQYKFVLSKEGIQPKTGEVFEVKYVGTLGGPKPTKTIGGNGSRSNTF